MTQKYWNWERAYGSTSVNVKEAYAELFNTAEFANVDTMVREAIQNILDAKDPKISEPVEVEFGFGESDDPFIAKFFNSLKEYRDNCSNINKKGFEKINWLYIKDRNTTGLLGDIHKRKDSNFWKYWMKFGSGSKEGIGNLGRHGVGRISIILGSQDHTLIGATLRKGEKDPVVSGISLLDNIEYDGFERTSSSLLVEKFDDDTDVFKLHGNDELKQILNAFNNNLDEPGFIIFVVNPKKEIQEKRIKAAVIEHFGSAIINNQLKVKVCGKDIDANNITTVASEVYYHFQIDKMKHDYRNYLEIVSNLHGTAPKDVIEFDSPQRLKNWTPDQSKLDEYREKINRGEQILFEIKAPITFKTDKGSKKIDTSFKVGFKRPNNSGQGVETYHRKGMSIPKGGYKLVLNGKISAVMTAADPDLGSLLNICEGKAHLSWSGTSDVLEELEKFCEDGERIRNMCAFSLTDLYHLIVESNTQPDKSVWDKFFTSPTKPTATKKEKKDKDHKDEEDDDEKENLIHSYKQIETDTGFKITGNPEFIFEENDFIRIRVYFAYEAEGKDPWNWWKEVDFNFLDLQQRNKMFQHQNCEIKWLTGNSCQIVASRNDFVIEASSFDTNRELAIKANRMD
jgi:hypothetical protein